MWPWSDAVLDTRVILHYINKDVDMDVHSLVHLFETFIRVETGGGPVRTFDSPQATSTSAMCTDWNILLQNTKYIGHNFLCLHLGGSPIASSHIGRRTWLRDVQCSNRLTA